MKRIYVLLFFIVTIAITAIYIATNKFGFTQENLSLSNKKSDVQTNIQKVPANVTQYKNINGRDIFVLDYLEFNPCFAAGGPLKPGCTTKHRVTFNSKYQIFLLLC